MVDRQPTIVREEIIVINHWEPDEYGNILIFAQGKDAPYKLSKKRANLAENLKADTQYKLNYANYMNRDYIANIECMESPEIFTEPVKSTVPEKGTNIPKIGTSRQENIGERTRSMSLSYAKDWCIAQGAKATIPQIISVATLFEAYINGGFLGDKLIEYHATPEEIVFIPEKKTQIPQPDMTTEVFKAYLKKFGWENLDAQRELSVKCGIRVNKDAFNMFRTLAPEKKVEFLKFVEENPKEAIT